MHPHLYDPQVLELPQSAVSLIAGKAGKKLYAMRRKSGAYVALVNKPKGAFPPLSLSLSLPPLSLFLLFLSLLLSLSHHHRLLFSLYPPPSLFLLSLLFSPVSSSPYTYSI